MDGITTGLNIESLVKGGLILSMLTGLVYSMKGVPAWLWSRIQRKIMYTVHIDELDELFYYFETWLTHNHFAKYRNVEASIEFKRNIGDSPTNENTNDSNHKKIIKEIIYKQYDDFFTIKYMGKRMFIFKGREKMENASNIRNAFFNRYHITAPFGRKKIDSLLADVLKFNLNLIKEHKKINIYTNTSYGGWEMMHDLHAKNIDDIILNKVNKDNLLNDLYQFNASEKWYKDRSITYKRGYLFHGPPGNGKTSICLAIAKHLKRDIYFLNSDIESNAYLMRAFRELKPNSMLVMEDCDCLFLKRDGKNGFSFSTFLNCTDGAFAKDGVITIMTTNHLEKLDPAMIRNGRIDFRMKIDNPDASLIGQYMSLFYNCTDVPLDLNVKPEISMSTVQEVCMANKNDIYAAVAEVNKMCIETANKLQTHEQ